MANPHIAAVVRLFICLFCELGEALYLSG